MTETILIFDTETTGLDTAKEQIIEICVQIGFGEDALVKTRRIKPTKAISKESSAIHGITAKDVKDCPTFKQLGKSILAMFDAADVIIGYNVTFDLQILQAELKRNGLKEVDLSQKHVVDPSSIWRKLKPRTLVAAYQEFCGKELVDAHSAEADVRATAEVYQGMLDVFKLKTASIEELAEMSIPSDWVGLSHHLKWKSDIPVFSFGKGKGRSVWSYLRENEGYFEWMKKNSFLPHVLEVCEKAIELEKEDFLSWVRARY